MVEEDCRFGGVGGEIAATLDERCFFSLDAPVQRLAGLDIPTPFNGALEAASIPRVPDIVEAARALYHSATDQETRSMKQPITMPALSDTMNNGRLIKWLKKPGDKVTSRRSGRGGRNRQGHHGGRGLP